MEVADLFAGSRWQSPLLPYPAEEHFVLLMIPGPIAVDERVIAILNRPAMNPHGADHMAVLRELFDALRVLFRTEAWVTVIAGSGRTGLEAAIVSSVEPEDATVHLVNGSFGELMVDITRRTGAQAAVVEGPWGGPVDLDAVEEAVERARPKLVTMVHSETSTGATHELEAVGQICRRWNALFMVDAVSSIATLPFAMDEAGVDLAVSASNKGIGALHGLSMVGVSGRAQRDMKTRKIPCQSYSLDLRRWDEMYFNAAEGSRRRSAYPPPTHLVYALLEACRLALDEGLHARWARCRRFAEATRAAVRAAAIHLFAEPTVISDSITAIVIPKGLDGSAILRDMEAQGIQIAGTVGRPSPVSGRLLRISHQGIQASEALLLPTLVVLERAMRTAGHPVALGTMLSAATQTLEDWEKDQQ